MFSILIILSVRFFSLSNLAYIGFTKHITLNQFISRAHFIVTRQKLEQRNPWNNNYNDCKTNRDFHDPLWVIKSLNMKLFNIMRSKCISTNKNEHDMAFNIDYHIFQIDERIVNCHNLHFWVFQRSAHNQPSNAAKSKWNGRVQKLTTRQRQWSLKEFIEERAVKPTSYFHLPVDSYLDHLERNFWV